MSEILLMFLGYKRFFKRRALIRKRRRKPVPLPCADLVSGTSNYYALLLDNTSITIQNFQKAYF
jgi:hypothetical protein